MLVSTSQLNPIRHSDSIQHHGFIPPIRSASANAEIADSRVEAKIDLGILAC